jgi:predicted methyltransferase
MKFAGLGLAILLIACAPAGQTADAQAPKADAVRRDASGFPLPYRPVAEIVTDTWSNEADRDKAQETEQVFAAAGVRPGMTVADIGAGSGYYVTRLSRAVGPQGRVYGEDIIPEYLKGLQQRVERMKLANVTTVLGTADDPKLPKAALDVVFLVHMYHEIERPYGLLHRLAGSFKPGGRLAITDADRRPENHGTPPALLKCELAAVGYRQVSVQTLKGDVGYLAIFEPPSPERLPDPRTIIPCRG